MCYSKNLANHLIHEASEDPEVSQAVYSRSPSRIHELLQDCPTYTQLVKQIVDSCTCSARSEGRIRRFVLHESAIAARTKLEERSNKGMMSMAS